jgi:hypothetical protein
MRGRWYPSGVLLPDGTVAAFSGADRDEVLSPGTEIPATQAELFDPATGKWTAAAMQSRPRTYHNTAALLPDGRVLVGGHAPIPTLYAKSTDLGGPFAPNQRDPSFEIFSPPYLFRGPRPVITAVNTSIDYAKPLVVTTPDAADIDHAVLVRNTTVTHLVDGDQRTVVLPVLHRNGDSVELAGLPSAAVAPPGPYLLFLDKKTDKGLVPSVGAQVFVAAPVPAWAKTATPTVVKSATATRANPSAAASGPPGVLPSTGSALYWREELSLLLVVGALLVWRRRLSPLARRRVP